ncbi:MAG: hypothetical protein WBY44_25065 [Bryobacteraceae bacterium]
MKYKACLDQEGTIGRRQGMIGATNAHYPERKTNMCRFWNVALLSAALIAPIAMIPLRAQDQRASRTYHDKQHNDDHAWSAQEDKAYRIYAKQSHRKTTDFSKLKEEDQQNYWNWRHEHSDTLLKIEIK